MTAPNPKPIRQPQLSSWSSARVAVSSAARPEAISWPTVVETYWK
jgi:hypothetical protein